MPGEHTGVCWQGSHSQWHCRPPIQLQNTTAEESQRHWIVNIYYPQSWPVDKPVLAVSEELLVDLKVAGRPLYKLRSFDKGALFQCTQGWLCRPDIAGDKPCCQCYQSAGQNSVQGDQQCTWLLLHTPIYSQGAVGRGNSESESPMPMLFWGPWNTKQRRDAKVWFFNSVIFHVEHIRTVSSQRWQDKVVMLFAM